MARMSIDDKFLRDPRVIRLGRAFGWRRQEAAGRLLDVYSVAYDREHDVLSTADIDIAAEQDGFADRMVEMDLAERVRSGLRIRGAAKRIAYLTGKHDAGRNGGIKSGESRRNSSKQNLKHDVKQTFGKPEARGNPPDVVPDGVGVVVPDVVVVPDPPIAPLGGDLGLVVDPPTRSRRTKPKLDATPDELASSRLVLGKLSAASGIEYRGCDDHIRLITAQLRAGVTEAELRAVVAYCANEWSDKPEMRKYLRPVTLFGPKTITRYLDAARTDYAKEIAEAMQPKLEVVR